VLNIVGTVDLPWGFQFGFISSWASKGPLSASVSGYESQWQRIRHDTASRTGLQLLERRLRQERFGSRRWQMELNHRRHLGQEPFAQEIPNHRSAR